MGLVEAQDGSESIESGCQSSGVKTKTGQTEDHQNSDNRLWIGNLDAGVTEYQLLTLLQKYGQIGKFDFLFHLSGPHVGLPRGYAFVTYKTKEAADQCLEELNGKILRRKPLILRWAREAVYDYNHEEERRKRMIPVLQVESKPPPDSPASRKMKIDAIEAKLKAMEQQVDAGLDFRVSEKEKLRRGNHNIMFRRVGAHVNASRKWHSNCFKSTARSHLPQLHSKRSTSHCHGSRIR